MVPLDQIPVDLALELARPHAGSEPARSLLLAAGSLWSLHKYRGLKSRIAALESRLNPFPMDISWKGSPNFTKGRLFVRPDRVVVHWMGGTLAGTDAHFSKQESKVSAHFGVEGTEVHQYVKLEDTAWHAGNWQWNLRSVGIEFSAQPGRDLTDEGYATGSRLIAEVCRRTGIEPTLSTVVPHKAVKATQCPGTVDVPRLITGARDVLYPDQRVLASVPVDVYPNVSKYPPNGYPRATVRYPTNVRTAPDLKAKVTEVLPAGSVQDVWRVAKGTPVNGKAWWFQKPNGLWFTASTTDYDGNGEL